MGGPRLDPVLTLGPIWCQGFEPVRAGPDFFLKWLRPIQPPRLSLLFFFWSITPLFYTPLFYIHVCAVFTVSNPAPSTLQPHPQSLYQQGRVPTGSWIIVCLPLKNENFCSRHKLWVFLAASHRKILAVWSHHHHHCSDLDSDYVFWVASSINSM